MFHFPLTSHKRSLLFTAVCFAVKDFNDPLYFLYLLNRPPHQRPKVGTLSSNGEGKKFKRTVKEKARKEADDQCVFCGVDTATTKPMLFSNISEIDHAIPRSLGGDGSIENAQNACHDCNNEKGNLTTTAFLVKRHGPIGLRLLSNK